MQWKKLQRSESIFGDMINILFLTYHSLSLKS